jgi:3-hydroxyisobutyrate dehydrogenase
VAEQETKGDKKERIAYLGMGIMGASMSCNLAKAGFNLTVWNRSQGKAGLKRALEAGAHSAASLSETVKEANTVIMCLSDVTDLYEVLLGAGGVVESARPGTTVIDMSTTGPECARKVSELLAARNLHFLDAPVSGGDVGARNATLTIMVGGEKPVFEKCLPIFESIGKNIRYCGASGSGQAVKLCNQVLCAVNMLAVCESLKLSELLGIDPQLMIEVCGSGAAGSWALSNLGPRIARGDLEPGFMIKDMQKDLRLVGEAIEFAPVELAACKLADSKFREAVAAMPPDGERKGTQAMSVAYRT